MAETSAVRPAAWQPIELAAGHHGTRSEAGFGQKTFWWSTEWDSSVDFQPAITVTGRQLDGDGRFSTDGRGTNASFDLGTAMLVGVDIPALGCWELTARYRDATLTITVEVVAG